MQVKTYGESLGFSAYHICNSFKSFLEAKRIYCKIPLIRPERIYRNKKNLVGLYSGASDLHLRRNINLQSVFAFFFPV